MLFFVTGMHGHKYESGGIVNVERTLCADTRSEFGEEILRGCLGDVEGDKAKSRP